MKISKCSECPFNGHPKVYGEGCTTVDDKVIAVKEDRQYDVVVVGMAPAEEELKSGRPFVGASGQILRRTLHQMGMKDYYVTNVLLCEITDDAAVDKARDCCYERLVSEIVSQSPKLVIALGDLPLHTLSDTVYKIKEVEGRVIPSTMGIPILPITHPAYYWRNPDQFFDFIECMRSGIRFLYNKYTQAVEPTLTLVNKDNLVDVLNKLDKYEEIAIDLETTGFYAYGWEPNKILEMGISVDHEHAYIVPAYLLPEFKELIEAKKGIFWNAQFDCGFLKQVGITANAYFDGMLAHYSIDERPYSHGLKRVAQIYLGTDDWEKEIGSYIPKGKKGKDTSYEVIPTKIRHEYLSKDVTRTYQLKEVLKEEVNGKVFWDMLMPACRMFIQIENRGMRIDPVKIMSLDEIFSNELDKLDKELWELTGGWINANSPKQVSELVYGKMGLPVDPHFGFGTSRPALEGYREAYPAIDKILDYRELSKSRGGYVDQFARFVDHNWRIHPSIKIFAAVTGRLSSEHPSIMNIKSLKELKRIFLAEPGHILGNFDIKGNELRWYCLESGDRELTKILREGGDPHERVRMVAYGEELDEYKKDLQRTAAKAGVFGRIYKRGRKDIERQFGHEVIDLLMETIDSIAPDIDNYYKDTMRQVRSQGYLESFFKRKRRFSLITPSTLHSVERQAVNFKPQSDGSDLMLLNMLHIFEIKDRWGIWPFWPVHDSITMDVPEKSMLPEIKKELEEYSLEVVHGAMPFPWDLEWGYNWAMDQEIE